MGAAMAPQTDSERLKALEDRLRRAKGEDDSPAHMDEHYSQAQLAWRMVIELVAGLGIGFGIGYGLDALFGTRPWLMVVFAILGFIAGVKTMIRSAKEIEAKAAQPPATDEGMTADGKRSEHDG